MFYLLNQSKSNPRAVYRAGATLLARSMEKPNIRENIGKSLLDVAKLTFASFILGGILRGELPQYILILMGAIVSTVCFTLGILWTSEKPKKRARSSLCG
jgi:hypothetical protein